MIEATRASLKKGDNILALGFAEAAVRLLPRSVEAALLLAEVDLALSLSGAAVRVLEAALSYAPDDGELHYRRATLAAAEGESALAASHFSRVPEEHPRHEEAQAAASAAADQVRSQADALSNLEAVRGKTKAVISRVQRDLDVADRESVRDVGSGVSPGVDLSRERVNSERTRARRSSDHFKLSYAIGSRDYDEREKWVGSVLILLERAWQEVGDRLDSHPDELFNVMAHTAKSYRARFHKNNPGMYSAGVIHLNRSSDPSTKQFFQTVVHEYVHAVLDRLAASRYRRLPAWFNEGSATYLEGEITGPPWYPPSVVAKARRLSPDAIARSGPFKSSGSAGYAKSWALVSALVASGTTEDLGHVTEKVGGGAAFDKALAKKFGRSLVANLDEEANTLLAGPEK